MQEIPVVRRRNRLWPIVLAVLVLALIAFAIWWFAGAPGADELGVENRASQPAASTAFLPAYRDGFTARSETGT